MNDDNTIRGPSLSVNDLCHEFQSLVEAQRSPQIADFLQRVDVDHRGQLLHELVALEIHLKARSDSDDSIDEWLHRYSGLLPVGEDREALRSTIENAIASTDGHDDPDATVIGDISGGRSRAGIPEIEGFEIESILGRGGMGVVYKAVQSALNRTVALKMILDDAASGEPLERFEKEAQAVAELNDPHFVQIYDFGQHKGRPYMTLEYVEGGSLEEFRQGEPQPERFTAEIMETLARAMQTAHAAGLVHRDLKPQNILMSRDGQPKISDFGLVKRQQQEEAQMTQSGHIVGTASYMAPEQSRGETTVAAAADIYALGGILYCLLTARPPFLGANVYETIRQLRTDAPVPPSRLRPGVSRDMETICLKCLQKEPQKRYASALELADDLRRFLDGRPIVARPVGVIERSWRWAKRQPAKATAIALTGIIAVTLPVLTAGLLISNNRLEEETTRANNEATAANTARIAADEHREKAETSQAAKSEQYNEFLLAFHKVLHEGQLLLRENMRDVLVRKKLIEIAMEHLDQIRDLDESNTLFNRNEAVGHQLLGDIFVVTGQLKEAMRYFDKACYITETAIEMNAEDATLIRNLAVLRDKQADVLKRLGNTQLAHEKFEDGLQLRIEWDKKLHADQNIDHVFSKTAIAKSYVQLGAINLSLGDATAALKHLRNARDWYEKLPLETAQKEFSSELSRLEYWLGEAHSQLGNADEAERRLKLAVSERQQLFKEKRKTGRLSALSRSQLRLGDFYMVAKKDPTLAWSQYQSALSGYKKLLQHNQDSVSTREGLANVEYRIGGLLLHAKAVGVGLEDVPGGDDPNTHFEISCQLRKQLAAIDPEDMQAKIEWAVALARCGRAVEAEELANELATKGKGNPRLLFQAACTFALCSEADDKEVADRCRERAFEVLEQLIKSGWKDRVVLQDDPDLAPIRKDARYAELLESLPAPDHSP